MSSASEEKSILDDCDFWCDTDGDKIENGVGGNHKTKFVWRVKNFSARTEQKGDFIESDSFAVMSPNGVATKWKLMLYPNGDLRAKDGYFSVFLKALETKTRADFMLYISDDYRKKKKALFPYDPKGMDFNPEDPEYATWGCVDAFSIDQVNVKWLFDDVLTLVCEMVVVETFYEIKQNHCLEMMEDLRKAFKGKNSLDVTVNCEDNSFECNKYMMTARSPVFKAMFKHDTNENQTNVVNLKDIEPKVLEAMILYIHTGETPNINNIAKELLVAADFYQLDQLKISCQEVLSETIEAKNSIELLILSEMYTAPKLRKNALKFVSENMTTISSACDWKKELAGYPSLQSEIIESLVSIMSVDNAQRGI